MLDISCQTLVDINLDVKQAMLQCTMWFKLCLFHDETIGNQEILTTGQTRSRDVFTSKKVRVSQCETTGLSRKLK